MFKPYDYLRFRDWFSTQEEYTTYCRCMNKVHVGDLVHLYVGQNKGRPSSVETQATIIRPVVGMEKGQRFLLGSYTQDHGFWPSGRLDPTGLTHRVDDLEKYATLWWMRTITDGRIAKIELGKNFKFEDFSALDTPIQTTRFVSRWDGRW